MCKTAILLATHNGECWINEQLRTILSQQHTKISLFVSDDMSSDSTLNIISMVAKANKNTQVMPQDLRFGSAAQNFFRLIRDVNLEQYSYIALADQDDVWFPNKLSRAIEIIQSKNLDGYSSNIIALWENGSKKLINKAQSQQKYDYMFESAGPGCTFVLSQKLALDLQSFLRSNYQDCKAIALHDWFAYAFARSKGYEWFIDPNPGMLYRQHGQNAVGANIGLKAFINRAKTLNQGWYIEQISLMAKILGYRDQAPIRKIVRLNFLDRLYLVTHAHQFRRRLRDQLAFAVFILFLARKQ